MQVTIDLPDQLARRLEAQSAKLEEIIERGLQQHGDGTSPHWREVIEFLARAHPGRRKSLHSGRRRPTSRGRVSCFTKTGKTSSPNRRRLSWTKWSTSIIS